MDHINHFEQDLYTHTVWICSILIPIFISSRYLVEIPRCQLFWIQFACAYLVLFGSVTNTCLVHFWCWFCCCDIRNLCVSVKNIIKGTTIPMSKHQYMTQTFHSNSSFGINMTQWTNTADTKDQTNDRSYNNINKWFC